MRSIIFSFAVMATGCGMAQHGTWGQTRSELRGTTSLVFVNATPQTMCAVRIQKDGERGFGDNWLPPEGLPSGKSLAVKVPQGTYMATWSTCKHGDKVYFAGTLTGETAFEVKDATQLYAFVADTVAPTKRAAPERFHAMVKFAGQPIGDGVQPVAHTEVAQAPAVPETQIHADLGAFVDRKAKPKTKMKASLSRKIDLSDSRVGYVERRTNR